MSERTASIGFAVCTLSWGSIGVLVSDVASSSPVITFFRLGLGFAIVFAYVLVTGRLDSLRPRARRLMLPASGVILAIHWTLQFEAYTRLPVAAAILIVFVGPVLAVVFAPMVLQERLRARNVVALALAFAGIVAIALPDIDRIDGLGVLAALGSGVFFAVLALVGKILSGIYEPAAVVAWQLGTAAVLISPVLITARAAEVVGDLPELLLLGLVLTGTLGVVFFWAIRVLEAQQFSVLFYLEPASAVVYAWVLLGQTPSAWTLTGGALIVLAGVAIILGDRATNGRASARTVARPTPGDAR